MTQTLLNHTLDKTLIVDDQQPARESYEETVDDANLTPVLESGPVQLGMAEYFETVRQSDVSAVLCDQVLSHRNYAHFEGAAFVARCVQHGLPAVLCTSYKEMLDDIRPYRRWIPSLQEPDKMGADELVHGFEACLREQYVGLAPHRTPWRTLVRVIDVREDEKRFFVEVPAWGPTVVPLKFHNIPSEVTERLAEGFRVRAQVNLGAENLEDLYLYDWQLIP